MGMDLDETAKQKAYSNLTNIASEFRKIEMKISAGMVEDVLAELQKDFRHSFDWLYNQAETIERLAHKELRDKFFLYVSVIDHRFR